MSIYGLLEAQKTERPLLPELKPRTGFMDVLDASFDNQRATLNSNSQDLMRARARSDAVSEYRRLTGKGMPLRRRGRSFGVDYTAYDEEVLKLRQEDPLKYKDLKTTDEIDIEAIRRAQDIQNRFADVTDRAGGFSGAVGGFVGGVAGSFTDPLNLALTAVTLPLGGGGGILGATASGGSKSVATQFLGNVFTKQTLKLAGQEALVNAGAEAASFAAVQEWQEKIGNQYGLNELLQNMATGAVFGASVPVVLRGAKVTKDIVYSKLSEAPLTDEARAAAQTLSRQEHLAESTPIENPTPAERNMHFEAVKRATDAFDEGRPMTMQDWDAIPLPTNRPDTDIRSYNIDVGLPDSTIDDIRKGVPKPKNAKLPKRLTQFIVERGGIVDGGLTEFERGLAPDAATAAFNKTAGGEVKSIIGESRARPGLINNKSGKSFDEMGEAAFEAGYFRQRPDRQEFFDALDRDFNYGEVYPENDPLTPNLTEYRDRLAAADDLGRYLDQAGVDYDRLSNDQVREAVKRLEEADGLSDHMQQLAREGYLGRPMSETMLPDDVERQLRDLSVIRDEPLDMVDADDVVALSQSNEALAAVDTDFDRLVDADQNMKLTLEDGTEIRLSDLNDELKESENFLKEITTCGIG